MFLDLISDAQSALNNLWPNVQFTIHQFLRIAIGTIDGFIYTADAEIYDLIEKIANAEVFASDTIENITGRIYQLLALIMMFRLIFVFINYVINPDDIVDKKKGLGNIAKKIIVTLILIVATPWAFMQSRNVQKVIFEDKVIEYFVFGTTTNPNASGGYYMMHTVGKLFITPYKCNEGTCTANQGDNLSGKILCEDTWDTDGNIGSVCGYGYGTDADFSNTLEKSIQPQGGKYDLKALTSLAKYGRNDQDSANHTGWDSDFYVDYRYPLIGSTVVGIFIAYMLISICIDIAIRSIKLAFYEIISPIPIISNIGSKDGKDSMLHKWFNDVLKTYLDLFVRIAGIQLATFFISMIMKSDVIKNVTTIDDKFIIKLFLILGALLFAKKLPEILKNLGINFDTGGFSLKKKLEPAMPMVRALTGATVGAIGGALSSVRASSAVHQGMAGNKFQKIGRGLQTGDRFFTGALAGAFGGAKSGFKAKEGLGFKSGMAAAGAHAQKIYNTAGTNSGRYSDRVRATMGLKTEADVIENDIKIMDTYAGFKKQMKDNADFYTNDLTNSGYGTLQVPNIERRGNTWIDRSTGSVASQESIAEYQRNQNINAAMKKGVKGLKQYYEDLQKSGTASAADITVARKAYEDAQEYVIGNNLSEQVNYIKNQAARYVKDNRRVLATQTADASANWKDLNAGFIQAANDATEVRASERYARAQYNKNWAQSGQSKK